MNIVDLQDRFWNLPPDSVTTFVINAGLVIALSMLFSHCYIKYGRAFSDRQNLARTFVLIALTTMLVISVVKTSLALSLGLIGALSIVRFRTPIKEPEELAYLFLTIGVGLGFGAGARYVTLFISGIILLVIVIRGQKERKDIQAPNLSIGIVKRDADGEAGSQLLEEAIEIVKEYSNRVDLVRLQEDANSYELMLFVETESFNQVEKIRKALRTKDKTLEILFVDNSSGKLLS